MDDVCVWHYVRTGSVILAADSYGMKMACFDISRGIMGHRSCNKFTEQAADELEEYFDGRRQKFKVALNPDGTDVQRKIWDGMCAIKYGKTKTAAELAAELSEQHGMTITEDEVLDAVKKNRISVIIPEHRIVKDNGSPYGWGRTLHRRQGLVRFELAQTGKAIPKYMRRWRLSF